MTKQFLIKTPVDFNVVVDELLSVFNQTNKDTLVIALRGDLGAGKTTFTQELAKAMGIVEIVTSPTFTIMSKYPILDNKFTELIHIDAYRIESEEEVGPLHFESVLNKPNTIVCIEWPQNIENIIPVDSVKVSIAIHEGEERVVSLDYKN
jgi:tRNA threonylcarbamoyladenosine biosynthesis protein TsaE